MEIRANKQKNLTQPKTQPGEKYSSRSVFYQEKLLIIKVTIEMGFIFTALCCNLKCAHTYCVRSRFRRPGSARGLEHLEKQPWATHLQLVHSYRKHWGMCGVVRSIYLHLVNIRNNHRLQNSGKWPRGSKNPRALAKRTLQNLEFSESTGRATSSTKGTTLLCEVTARQASPSTGWLWAFHPADLSRCFYFHVRKLCYISETLLPSGQQDHHHKNCTITYVLFFLNNQYKLSLKSSWEDRQSKYCSSVQHKWFFLNSGIK